MVVHPRQPDEPSPISFVISSGVCGRRAGGVGCQGDKMQHPRLSPIPKGTSPEIPSSVGHLSCRCARATPKPFWQLRKWWKRTEILYLWFSLVPGAVAQAAGSLLLHQLSALCSPTARNPAVFGACWLPQQQDSPWLPPREGSSAVFIHPELGCTSTKRG